jgi:hypothetical protein
MTNPVKEALSTISRHSGLVAEALKAPLSPGDGAPIKAIMDMRNNASAVRPTSDEGWRLHPRLREYLFDHLQHYPAYQSLSEIGSYITTMNALWAQVEELHGLPDGDSTMELRDRLQDTVYDIADNMRRNLQQLQTLLSTRYGNVRTLEAKKSQNRWYRQQTSQLIHHLGLLANASARIEQAASDLKMHEFAHFMRTNLVSRVLGWQQSISEMQALLTREIFQTREIEIHHRQLARMDMLLRQQPAWTGVEIDLDGEIPDFLLAARLPDITAHVEPADVDESVQAMIVETAASLPALRKANPPEEQKRYRKKDPKADATPQTPEMLASERLLNHVMESTTGVSLVEWRLSDQDAMTLEPDLWLVFSMQLLRMADVKVILLRDPPRAGERFSRTFHDAIASGPKRIWSAGQ